jgi:hypothetical protein
MNVDLLKALSNEYNEIFYNTLLNYYDKEVLDLIINNLNSDEIFQNHKFINSDEITILIGCNKNRTTFYLVDIVVNINDNNYHIKFLYSMSFEEYKKLIDKYGFETYKELTKKVTS